MADISKIKPLGSNTTYNIKDNSAIANITRSGTTFTATRRDGTTFTFNQQDNNTWNSLSTSQAGYVTKAPNDTNQFLRGDATWAKVTWDSIDGKPANFSPSTHTHATSLDIDTGTSQITLAYGEKYKLTTGGTSIIFTMPSTSNISITKSQISDFSHNHGCIQNDGTIQGSQVSIENGDRLMILDSTDNKIQKTSLTFDGVTTTKALTQKGTWETFNNYSHPTTTAVSAAAVKVGKDSTGHVVIGSALTKSDVGLSNVENTKLSTWTGTNNITTLGTITIGTWNGNIIDIAHGGTNATTIAEAWSNIVAPGGIITGNLQVNGNTNFVQSPIAPTPESTDNSTKIATTAFVKNSVAGLSGAMHFKGITTSEIVDGSTTNPITINNSSYTASAGDVVLREITTGNIFEYVWTGTNWEMLGRDTSFKVTQTAVSSPSASGATTAFIDTISQNANGAITVTKKNLDTSGEWSGNAATATVASKLSNTSKIGDTNKPVYFKADGTPAVINYTIDKSVPSNAVFTDRYVDNATFADDSTNTAASPVKMTLTRAGSDTETVTANIPKVSSSSAGVAPKGTTVSSQSQSTKFLREDGTWAAPSYTVNTNTDTLVKQTAKSDNKNYKILFTTSDSPTSGNANEAAYDTNITINPNTHTLTATNLKGILSTQDLRRPTGLRGLNDVTLQTLVSTSRANRLAFLPADQIIIEKTTDGGATWVDAEVSDATKLGLFSETRTNVYLPLIEGKRNILCGLRITITAMKYNVPDGTPETEKYNYWNSTYVNRAERYCLLKDMYFWLNAISDSIGVTVQRATGANSNSWSTIFNNSNFYMTGQSGCNYINFSQNVFGGSKNQTTNYWNYRITLMTKGVNGTNTMVTSNTTAPQGIMEIRGYGDAVWTVANNYMSKDHIYSFDENQNTTFPANVTATKFVGSLEGNATTATTAGGITASGTTAQFWRGDNSWSNILAQTAATTLGIDTSNLRIGTTVRTLHIATKYSGAGAGITEGDSAGITFGVSNAAYAGIYYQSSGSYGSRLYFATTNSFGNGAYARMIITQDGKVGIHTASPSTRLHVDGDVTVTGLTASQAVSTDANKKLVSTNLTVSDPTASGTGITYIATISQSAVGKITATKRTVQSASTSQTGVLQFTAANTNAQLNTLTTGGSTPTDNDYYISQYAGGGTTTTTYHRRPVSALWNYMSGKITNGIYWANIKTTSAATYKAQPEVASIKINGKTAAGDTDSVSTKNVQLVYDASLETLNFVFL